MFDNVTVGLKEGLPHEPMLEFAQRVTSKGGQIHLITLVRAGTYEDEPERLRRARQDLARCSEGLEGAGFSVSTQVDLMVVSAASELINVCLERGSDLMVIGLAKRTRVGKVLMGSDAQRVLLGSEVPVLSVPLHRLM